MPETEARPAPEADSSTGDRPELELAEERDKQLKDLRSGLLMAEVRAQISEHVDDPSKVVDDLPRLRGYVTDRTSMVKDFDNDVHASLNEVRAAVMLDPLFVGDQEQTGGKFKQGLNRITDIVSSRRAARRSTAGDGSPDTPPTAPDNPAATKKPEAHSSTGDRPELESAKEREKQLKDLRSGLLMAEVRAQINEHADDPHKVAADLQRLRDDVTARTSQVNIDSDVHALLNEVRAAVKLDPLFVDGPEATGEPVKEPKEKRTLDKKLDALWGSIGGRPLERTREKDYKRAEAIHIKGGSEDLQKARIELAVLMAYQERTGFRGVDQEKLKEAQEELSKEVLKNIDELAKQLAPGEVDLTKAENLTLYKAKAVLQETALIDKLAAQIIESRGGKGAKFFRAYRRNPKLRIGVGLAASAAGVAGVGIPLSIPVRAYGAFNTYHSRSESFHAKRAHKDTYNPESARNLSDADLDKPLSTDILQQRYANLLSARSELSTREKFSAKDEAAITKLDGLISARMVEEMRANPGTSIDEKMADLLGKHLEQRNNRTKEVRKLNRRRFVKGTIAAAALSAPGMKEASWVAHHAMEKGSPVAQSVGEYLKNHSILAHSDALHEARTQASNVTRLAGDGLQEVGHVVQNAEHGFDAWLNESNGFTAAAREVAMKSGGEAARQASTSAEAARQAGAEAAHHVGNHLGRFVDHNWTVKPGESMWSKSWSTLTNFHGDWDHFSASQRIIATSSLTDHLGDRNLILPNQHFIIRARDVRAALELARNYKG